MLSLMPGTPGRSEHMPRIVRSIGTPACDARYKASITFLSSREWSGSGGIFSNCANKSPRKASEAALLSAHEHLEHLVEEPSTLLGLALLEYEASGHHWNENEAEEHGFSESRHTGYVFGEGVNLIRYARKAAVFQRMTHKRHHRTHSDWFRQLSRRVRNPLASRGLAAGRWRRAAIQPRGASHGRAGALVASVRDTAE